jgi:hypothetical protein
MRARYSAGACTRSSPLPCALTRALHHAAPGPVTATQAGAAAARRRGGRGASQGFGADGPDGGGHGGAHCGHLAVHVALPSEEGEEPSVEPVTIPYGEEGP